MCLALQNSYFSVIHYQNRGRSGNKLCLTYKLNYSRISNQYQFGAVSLITWLNHAVT